VNCAFILVLLQYLVSAHMAASLYCQF